MVHKKLIVLFMTAATATTASAYRDEHGDYYPRPHGTLSQTSQENYIACEHGKNPKTCQKCDENKRGEKREELEQPITENNVDLTENREIYDNRRD